MFIRKNGYAFINKSTMSPLRQPPPQKKMIEKDILLKHKKRMKKLK